MIDDQVLMFAGVALVLTITPGADTMLVVRSVLTANWQAGIATSLGVCTGLLIHALCSTVGISLILVHSATIFEIVKFIGGCYLIVLGIQAIAQALKHPSTSTHLFNNTQQKTIKHVFITGLLTNLFNPKVALFYLAFLPQFIRSTDTPFTTSILLSSIHLLFSFVWLVIVASFVRRLKTFLIHPQIKQILETITGCILITLGTKLALGRK